MPLVIGTKKNMFSIILVHMGKTRLFLILEMKNSQGNNLFPPAKSKDWLVYDSCNHDLVAKLLRGLLTQWGIKRLAK